MTGRKGRADDIRPYGEIKSAEGRRATIKVAPTEGRGARKDGRIISAPTEGAPGAAERSKKRGERMG